MDTNTDREILAGFVEEVTDYLPAIRAGLKAFAAAPGEDVLEEATRFAHTIKGAAAMVGLSDLSHAAFHLENLLENLGERRIEATEDRIARIDLAVDRIASYLAGVRADTADAALLAEATTLLAEAGDDPNVALGALPASNASDDTIVGLSAPESTVAEPSADDTRTDLRIPELTSEAWGASEAVEPNFDLPPVPTFEDNATSPMSADGPSEELVEVFRMEAEDHLRVLTTLLPEARQGRSDPDMWQEVRRAAHTLKGAATMVGFAEVTAIAHRMEDLLDQYFEGKRLAEPGEIDLLLASTDAIEDSVAGRGDPETYATLFTRFDALGLDTSPAPVPAPALKPKAAQEPAGSPADARAAAALTVRVPIDKLAEVSKISAEQVIARTAFEQRMAAFSRLLSELQASTGRLKRVSGKMETGFEAAALGGGRFAGSTLARGAEGFDDLEFDRYTEFHLLSRELVETAADLQTLADELGHVHTDFDGYLTRQARLASETEDKLTRLRMVPLSSVAGKLHRTVRTAAQHSGKEAQFVLDGERTGLDKTVLDAMGDALLHLLRNAVDHGLEPAEVRTALGKPAMGTVKLRAEHEGSQVVLTIEDDGRGVDPDAIREAAVRRGLASEESVADLTLEQLSAFLFSPGFSTRSEVTELSGRGVGLDVVKTKVESLRGTVSLTSKPGAGTTFTVRLPMTLAVIRALIVRANQETFAIPLEAVEQIRRYEASESERVGREPVIRVGGQVYPVIRLGERLGLTRAADETTRPPVVLIKAGGRQAAIVVDALQGGREVVVKRVGSQVRRCPAVAGATLTGDGGVVLILNPADLVRPAASVSAPSRTGSSSPTHSSGRRELSVLIVDDSPSVRRVLTGLAQRSGWAATTAKDGMEAMEILQLGTLQPDIVLSDIEMPRMDGYELLGTIRGVPAFQDLPVVMITSRAADKHRRKAMDLGASAYVVKPYQDGTLVEIVRRLTSLRRSAAPVAEMV